MTLVNWMMTLSQCGLKLKTRKVKVHCVVVSIDIQIVMSPSLWSILKQHKVKQ